MSASTPNRPSVPGPSPESSPPPESNPSDGSRSHPDPSLHPEAAPRPAQASRQAPTRTPDETPTQMLGQVPIRTPGQAPVRRSTSPTSATSTPSSPRTPTSTPGRVPSPSRIPSSGWTPTPGWIVTSGQSPYRDHSRAAIRAGTATRPRRSVWARLNPAQIRIPSARAVVRSTGEMLITLGVLVLMFAAYQLVYTNVQANRAAAAVGHKLERQWAVEPTTGPAKDRFAGIQEGEGFAFLHIPRLGSHWRKPIVQGVGPDELARGVGHYPDSAMPGRIGNFAVAGHRATHGEPFRDLDRLRTGDVVVVEAAKNWYIYRIDNDGEIVLPSEVGVVLPVPNQPGVKPTERLLTLTTCNPRWGSTHRLIFWGHLESVQPKSEGRPAALGG